MAEQDFKLGMWASLVAQMAKNLPAMPETWVQFLGWEDPWRRERQPTVVFLHGEFPVQGNSWQATVHGVAKSLTLSLYVLSQTVPKKKGVFLGFP